MDSIESYEHAGMTVEITIDPMPQDCNPREHTNVGVMLCGHRRYILGDEQITGDDFSPTITCPSCNGTGENSQRGKLWRRHSYGWVTVGAGSTESMMGEMSRLVARAANAGRPRASASLMVETCDCLRCEGSGEIDVSLDAYLRHRRGATVILPLGLIDHSGISMYVGAGAHRHDPGGWDSGQVGVIFDTTETRKECGMENARPEDIERALRAEVTAYDQFLRGEVYCYTVTDPAGEHLDSCCGFLGDLEYVRSQANDAAEYAAQAAERERKEKYLMACRDIATASRAVWLLGRP
jgi:hypothetical protein